MEFAGKWVLHSDGVSRPMVRGFVFGADGTRRGEDFLLDTGADQTVFSAAFFLLLGFPATPVPGATFVGVGGETAYTEVFAVLELEAVDGTRFQIQGTYTAFLDPAATAYNILGRDVLNEFDVLVACNQGDIRLLRLPYHYQILGP